MKLSGSDLEVMRHSYTAIPEQMGSALMRSAYSPNIKERKDESCAIFDARGRMLVQAEHIPVHLGAMPLALKGVIDEVELGPRDQAILNDPYKGGTHLPDITVIKPVYMKEDLLGYVVNRAHHADIGGKIPGSMPGKTEKLEEEGIVISPQKIVENGEFKEKVLNLLRKARSPEERVGDIKAQVGANERGASDFCNTTEKFGIEKYKAFIKRYFDYSEERARSMIEEIPDGSFSYEDYMELGEKDIPLRVEVRVQKDKMVFDFSGTSEQVKGNINAPYPVTLSAVYYILKCLLPVEVPLNAGTYEPITVKAEEGSLLNAKPPFAVSAGNVETSQRIVELILRALQDVLPQKIPAESMGTMNNIAIGSDSFTYYETIGGGAGAYEEGNGASGVHVHMTNTKNTPIEGLENFYPLSVLSYRLRDRSGGDGFRKGGEGIIRELRIKEEGFLSIQSERRRFNPRGMNGGGDGRCGNNYLIKGEDKKKLGGKVTIEVEEGDIVRIETPGGGGWGKKSEG